MLEWRRHAARPVAAPPGPSAAASPCPGSGGEAARQVRTHTTAPQVAPAPSRSQPIAATHATHPPEWDPARGDVPQTGSESTGACGECPPNRVGIHRRLWRGSSRIPCPSACPTRARVRSGIQTCTVRSQMSQSDVPIQNSQYVALFDDFCILVAPESDFPAVSR